MNRKLSCAEIVGLSVLVIVFAYFSFKKMINEDTSYSEPTTEATTQTTEIELSFKDELLTHLDKEIVDKLIDIITVDIGIPYDELYYSNDSKPSTNYYVIGSDSIQYALEVTADNDDVYRIWNGEFEFYNYELENPVVTTLEQYNFKTLSRDERTEVMVDLDNIMDDALKYTANGKVEEEYYTKNGNFIQVVGTVSGKNGFNAKVFENYVVQFFVTEWGTYNYEVSYIKIGDDASGTYVEME